LAKALVEAIDGDMDVINMSLAGPNDTLLSLLIGKAVDAGIVFVAAGNPENPAAQFPASLPTVHSPNQRREYWFARSEQLSTQAGGSYQVFFGSSIASSGITGLAVLLRSKYTAAQTNSLLDWLFESDCAQNAYPVEAVGFDLERLCE
jgi:subtilisin family serine protease